MTKKFVRHELLGKHLGGPLYGANRQILVEVTFFDVFGIPEVLPVMTGS